MHTFNKEWSGEEAERDVEDYGIERPFWIEDGVSIYTLDAIRYGGCASGAYMPAVTYRDAANTMHEYGNEVLDYIQDQLGELPKPDDTSSWDGMACFYLSYAVELWARAVDQDLDPVEDYED